MRLVLDNSVVMRWLFGDGSEADRRYAEDVLACFEQEETVALVPAVWPLEVGNVVARAEAKGLLQEAHSIAFLSSLRDLAIEIDPASNRFALSETLQLARRHGLSTYDASYLELALREDLPLATLDADLRRALKKAGGRLALEGMD
jgi:predicted nucleic acid-binding protein